MKRSRPHSPSTVGSFPPLRRSQPLTLEAIPSLPMEALRLHLNSFNLATSGRRPQLIARLRQHIVNKLPGCSRTHASSSSRRQGSSVESGAGSEDSDGSAEEEDSEDSAEEEVSEGSAEEEDSDDGAEEEVSENSGHAASPNPPSKRAKTRYRLASPERAGRHRHRSQTNTSCAQLKSKRRSRLTHGPRHHRSCSQPSRRVQHQRTSPTDRHHHPVSRSSSSSSDSSRSSRSSSSSTSSSRSRSRSRTSRHQHRRCHHHHTRRRGDEVWDTHASCVPPPSKRLRRKIRKGEYINFCELLSPVDTPPFGAAKRGKSRRETFRRVVDCASWVEAWNRYLCACLTYDPSRALELAVYQTNMCMLFAHHPPAACIEYDQLFRQLACQDRSLRWDYLKDNRFVCPHWPSTVTWPVLCPNGRIYADLVTCVLELP